MLGSKWWEGREEGGARGGEGKEGGVRGGDTCWVVVAVRVCWGLVAIHACWALIAIHTCWCWNLVGLSSVVFIWLVVFGLWVVLGHRCHLWGGLAWWAVVGIGGVLWWVLIAGHVPALLCGVGVLSWPFVDAGGNGRPFCWWVR